MTRVVLMVRECDKARIDVSNIPSDKVSVLHLKLTNANLQSFQVSLVFRVTRMRMVRECFECLGCFR